jgi:glycosyltransferase involved in cell wall biosynthesis
MANTAYPSLVMLGPAPQARGGIASVVQTYRVHGLFERWPIEYLATHGEDGARDVALALSALRRFAVLLLRERGMAVHVHAAAGHGFWREALFMALAIAMRRPLILHLHGGGFEQFHHRAGPLARGALSLLLECAACVVVPCEAMRGWIRGIARGAQVACVPEPVAPEQAPPAERQANLVLFLGRLDAAKGLFDLFEAVAALRAAVPDLRLLCAGDGDRAAASRQAERLGIADAVKFTGWVGPSGRRVLLESAAVFALPSYDEALPMNLIEAMAAGIPVVASAVGGIPEAVSDGVTGFLVAPGDIATLQRQLKRLLAEPTLGARVGAAASESVRLRFAPERALPRLEEVYAAVGLCALVVTPARFAKPA